jgi:putative DNA primase/helicase
MYQHHWEFHPTHKAVLCTNHCPEVSGTDHAIWRRLALVPFKVRFWDPDKGESGAAELMQDKTLLERLKGEAAGILAWCVRGCLDWQEHGLKLPAEVLAATRRYRIEEDSVAAFIDDCCILEERNRVSATELYFAYYFWCQKQGRDEICMRIFGQIVGNRFDKVRSNGSWYLGVGLRKENEKHDTRRSDEPRDEDEFLDDEDTFLHDEDEFGDPENSQP